MTKVSKIPAIAGGKCPRCRKGRVFQHPAYHLRKFTLMNKTCQVCGLPFEIEPGFFWGAMYFSYALNIAEMVPLAIACFYIFNDPGPWVYIAALVAVVVLLMPVNFRLARILMLHMVAPVKYDPNYADRKHKASL